MRTSWVILSTLISASYVVHAETPASLSDSFTPITLNDVTLDSITAGGVASMTAADAFAYGQTYANTKTIVLTNAIARPGVMQTGGQGTSIAQGNGFAMTTGTSTSIAGTTGVSVGGTAAASGAVANAFTSVWTKAIDTRYADIAIGHVHSVACCGTATGTSAQASTFTGQDFNAAQIVLKDVNTPHLSLSVGNAVIVSVSHP